MSHSEDTVEEEIYDFSIKCLKELKNKDDPLIFSPMSLMVTLSMVYSGAKGRTKREFDEIFQLKYENNELHEYFFKFIKSLKETPPNMGEMLKTANKIYVHNEYDILESYSKLLSKYYDGQFESINFHDNNKAAKKINLFISDATNEKIQNLISPDLINDMTRIILVNCLYFSGVWSTTFKDYNTHDDLFYKNENSHKKVKFMKRNDYHMFSENEASQLVLLDYRDGETKFGILLPKKKHDILNVLNNLTGKEFFKLIDNASKVGVEINIPKFKIDSKFNLNESLKNLNLKHAFSDEADFTGINKDGKIFISQVIQQVFIDVHEQGTEAAAATAIIMEFCSLPITPDDPIIFKADHPFFFFILYKEKYILFNGIYM